MQSKVWIAGAIVAVIIVCLVAIVAIFVALQSPATASQSACSVSGYVVNTFEEGIPGTKVEIHVMGPNDTEVYNMTAMTNAQPYEGLFVFDNVVITPDAGYAYLSTTVQKNGILYYGRTDNFTLEDKAAINRSIIMHMPPKNMTSVSGYVVNSYGTSIPGVTVTLHMIGAANSSDLNNMTTVTSSTELSAGQYAFDNVIPASGTQYGYVSTSASPATNYTVYGRSDNFTFNGEPVNMSIVLHIPPEYANAPLKSP